MNVIGHEAIADERKPVQSTMVPQQVEVDEAFSIRRENELQRVPWRECPSWYCA
jgi:hypothetical protein